MAYSSIPASKREVGKPIDKDLIDNIHDNLEDLNSRVNGISISAGQNVLINDIVKKPRETLPVGTLVHASLTTGQFTAEVDGGTWALADGSSAVGTDWATVTGKTTLPDARGRFLRAKSHASGVNPAGDLALDAVTADTVVSHDHAMNHSHTFSATTSSAGQHTHELAADVTSNDLLLPYSIGLGNTHFLAVRRELTTDPDYVLRGTATAPSLGVTGFTGSHTHTVSGTTSTHSTNTGATGSSETAPKYITENVLIKVNRAYITTDTRVFLCRVNQQTTVNSILLSPVVQGTAGNLKIDILKGNTPTSATTSIFQSGQEPTLAWNGSSGVTGLVNSSQNVVNAGQWLAVSITETQTRLQQFHLFVAGDL
jgi:hypothetical protein